MIIEINTNYIELANGELAGGIILQKLVEMATNLENEYKKTKLKFDSFFEINFEKISKENMLGLSKSSIRRYVKKLVDENFITEDRSMAKYKYRVNKKLIFKKLSDMGEERVKEKTEEPIHTEDEMEQFGYTQTDIFGKIKKNVALKIKHNTNNYNKYNTIYEECQDEEDKKLLKEIEKAINYIYSYKNATISINKINTPIGIVMKKFEEIDEEIIQKAIQNIRSKNYIIRNLRGYLITTLYNTIVKEKQMFQNETTRGKQHNYRNKNSFVNYTQREPDYDLLRKIERATLISG